MTQSQTISKSGAEEERKHLVAQCLTAHTLMQIEQANCDLRKWLALYPDDIGMEDLFEVLALRTPSIAADTLPAQEAA